MRAHPPPPPPRVSHYSGACSSPVNSSPSRCDVCARTRAHNQPRAPSRASPSLHRCTLTFACLGCGLWRIQQGSWERRTQKSMGSVVCLLKKGGGGLHQGTTQQMLVLKVWQHLPPPALMPSNILPQPDKVNLDFSPHYYGLRRTLKNGMEVRRRWQK